MCHALFPVQTMKQFATKLIPLYGPKNLLRNGSRRIIHSLLLDSIDLYQSLLVLPLLQVLFHLCSRPLSHHLFFADLIYHYKTHIVYLVSYIIPKPKKFKRYYIKYLVSLSYYLRMMMYRFQILRMLISCVFPLCC